MTIKEADRRAEAWVELMRLIQTQELTNSDRITELVEQIEPSEPKGSYGEADG